MLEKTYDPKTFEASLYEEWEGSDVFGASVEGNGQPFTVMMPPPNVTGSLHMGHALNMTLQDVMTRWHRRRGRDALWQPGTDHAGIATQMVVERQLKQAGTDRWALGRDRFVERVWDWKAESGGMITDQLRRLGTTPDWSRERFTMDEGLSKAVVKVFVDLYKQGLIYRDKRLVNWDPSLQTAISDLEVEQKEVKGHLWHLRYPLVDDPDRFITVATTRPETMLGDTGVAVHPDDERYQDLIGRRVLLPIVGREIPIVADTYADPEQGSGAVKITPAHDFNDFEVGKRQNLAMINILTVDARINDQAPEAYRGLDRYDARIKVIAEFEALGLLDRIEDHVHMVPYGDRGGVPIEPFLTDQWYCDAATLAKPAIEAVETGRTEFVPKSWENTYFEWMRNIQPWCISRQLWWGHQIPAWYGPDGTVFVEPSAEHAQGAAQAHYGTSDPVDLVRDEDVLDTWFSSALWPFSTLGWPDDVPEVQRYYPGDTLVTGFDIIFFWVARMMMMGLHFMGEVPFRTIYMHALVRDEKGQKMSKSKGNVMDPLELVDRYGADALRFTLISMAAQGRDIKLSNQRVEGYRNFATKLWNATRYCEMNDCVPRPDFDPTTGTNRINRWIVSAVVESAAKVDKALAQYRFNEAAAALYQFAWNTFCDWYLEFTKPILHGDDAALAEETRATTAWALTQLINLLNPLMPFVTEALWESISRSDQDRLIGRRWPELAHLPVDTAAQAEMDWVIGLISEVRTMRSEMNVPAGAEIAALIKDPSEITVERLDRHRPVICRLARLNEVSPLAGDIPTGSAQGVLGEATLILPLEGVIDLDQERARLTKEISKWEAEVAKIDKKLGNAQFLAKAPGPVVEEQRSRRVTYVANRDRLTEALNRIASAN